MNIDLRAEFPRLPLDGKIDLTYRCNNNCRHCWLWLESDAKEKLEELSFDELRYIVDDARRLGCQAWSISGGEPMLRSDFIDIYEYLQRKSINININTNGTLITPKIAKMLKNKGKKMVALYGATSEVHDKITRNPGSYEATMRGFAYLIEACVPFIVQIVPMQENFHQYNQMLVLAETLGPMSRVGASWLWLSACHSASRNRQISRQRLTPSDVVILDDPDPISDLVNPLVGEQPITSSCADPTNKSDDRLFASCIDHRRDFHIDPYGKMSFCYYIKDPVLRYDLRKGTFREAWNDFIPSLKDSVHGGQEYLENCGSCSNRSNCNWCAVYGYLEHGQYTAKVDYLCQVAKEKQRYKEDWKLSHLRYYQIAGITLQIAAEFPFEENTYIPTYEKFRVAERGDDTVSLRLISPIPDISHNDLGHEVYNQPPWAIYKRRNSWVYKGITSTEIGKEPYLLAVFSLNHSNGIIYRDAEYYRRGNIHSLTSFVTDQLLVARLLADRQGCYLHSAGIIIDGQGYLFVGHSEAGKSTMLKMLRGEGEILCDDRIIVRRWKDGFHIHGTWSHGELPDVSPSSAPLKALFFLEKADTNELIPIDNKKEYLGRILSHVVKPLITAEWWEKTMDLAARLSGEVPSYRLKFDKSGKVVDLLKKLN